MLVMSLAKGGGTTRVAHPATYACLTRRCLVVCVVLGCWVLWGPRPMLMQAHYVDMIDQTTLGHRFLKQTVGAGCRCLLLAVTLPLLRLHSVLPSTLGWGLVLCAVQFNAVPRAGWQIDPFGEWGPIWLVYSLLCVAVCGCEPHGVPGLWLVSWCAAVRLCCAP